MNDAAIRTFSLHRIFLRMSLAAANAFAWVIIIETMRGSLVITAGLYALASLISFAVTPISARFVSHGLLRSIVLGAGLFSLGCAIFALVISQMLPWPLVIAPLSFVIFSGVYRALYWVPYRAEGHAHQLPELTRFSSDILISLAPVVGGYIIAALGMAWFFLSAAALAALSVIALAGAPERAERFSWNYNQTFRALFSKRHHSYLISALLEGVEGAGLFFIWPLAIFLLVGGSFITLGAIVTITLLVMLAVRLLVRYAREQHKVAIPHSIFVLIGISGWLMRLGVVTPFQIIAVDAFHSVSSTGRSASLDLPTFEQAADSGEYLDEMSALKEMGLAIGRILVAAFIAFAAFSMPDANVLVLGIIVAASASFVRAFVGKYS